MTDNSEAETFNAIISATIVGVGTIIVSYIFALFILYGVGEFISFESPDPLISSLAYALEFGIIGVAVFVISYVSGVHNYISLSKPSKSDLKTTGILLVLMLIIQVLSAIFLAVTGIESASNAVVDIGQDSPVFYLYMIPVMILFVGPIEEYMFRGVIQSVFTEKVNRDLGIAVASILFGLIHISAVGGLSLESIPYIVTATILGICLGYYYDVTDNLVVPMVAHGIYNSILMIVSYSFLL